MTCYERDEDYTGRCAACGSPRWVSISMNGGTTRVPQCVPCGRVHPGVVLRASTYREQLGYGGELLKPDACRPRVRLS